MRNHRLRGWGAQLIRYYSCGLVINVVGYLAFVLLVRMGMPVKSGFTIIFIIATTISFLVNRRYVFKSKKGVSSGYAMHWLNAGMAYVINILILWVCVDSLKLRAEYVQIASTIFISCLLFLSNKVLIHKSS